MDVKAGEYLLAVRGIELKPPTELFSLFENTADKSIEITVGPKPDGKGSRTVTVEPLASEDALRNRDWVEGNLRRSSRPPAAAWPTFTCPTPPAAATTYFKRYFYPQSDKEAIIVDERFNGGGEIADYYIDHLPPAAVAMWATRYGEDIASPGARSTAPR